MQACQVSYIQHDTFPSGTPVVHCCRLAWSSWIWMCCRKRAGISLQFRLLGHGWERRAKWESRRPAVQMEAYRHLPSPILTSWAKPQLAVTQHLLFIPPFSPGPPPWPGLQLQWSTAPTGIPQNTCSLLSLSSSISGGSRGAAALQSLRLLR